MLFFRQYDLGCLSSFSYLIGDRTTGRAVVVDPQRDIGRYLADAEAEGLTIERVVETHFHADFLSGHLELAAATGAAISYGTGAHAGFPIEQLADRQRLVLGEVVLEVRATPGHTPESISVVVYERPDAEPWGVLTGDTLFIGDVGRPDLLASVGSSADELGRHLHRSLHQQLMTLPDATRVFPAHGAGSACGKAMSATPESTIGAERASNYALQPMDEDTFVQTVLEGQSLVPPYFPFAAAANRSDHALLQEDVAPRLMDAQSIADAHAAGAAIIDTRAPDVFALGHLPDAINVSIDARFAEFVGDVVAAGRPIVLVADPERATEAKVRLARIGFDDVRGVLTDVVPTLEDHPRLRRTAARITPEAFAAQRDARPTLQLVDVRSAAERAAGIIPGAMGIALPELAARLGDLDAAMPTIVYCGSGVRSSVAASFLRANGFEEVADLSDGFGAWVEHGYPVVAPSPSSA